MVSIDAVMTAAIPTEAPCQLAIRSLRQTLVTAREYPLKFKNTLTSAAVLALFALWGSPGIAALPACASAASDSDGDGYGWENNASCRVQATTSNTNSGSGAGSSTGSNSGTGSSRPACSSAAADPDGDGFGWENNRTCIVTATTGSSQPTSSTSGLIVCALTSSDPDGDGYGWENNASCRVTADSAPMGDPDNAGSGSSDQGQSNADSGASGSGQGSSGNFTSDTGGTSVLRRSALASTSSREICTTPNDDWFAWMTVGDFIFHTNTWAAWASQDYEWSQCIYTNKNGAKAGVYYDWGSGRGAGDYQVRSYPELIYGVKDEFRASPKSVTGLPESIDNLPGITIDYSMNWPEYGPSRAVVASANPRYPNGSIIQGERNVSIESFFYNPDASGQCSEGIVKRNGGSNHTYEIMVWLNAGAERLPAGPSDYVTDITLDNAAYKVYTKNSDRKYIAFVAQNPQQTGSLNWNTFIDWATLNAHRVQALYGARTNSVPVQTSWCMGNIIVGTEIFWGEGNLDFLDWSITQTQ